MTNLFLNPGFELDFTNWTPDPASTISIIDPQAGTKCVQRQFTTVSGGGNIVAQFVGSLTIGISYTVSMWVKPSIPPTPMNEWDLTVFLSGQGTTTLLDINNNYGTWRKVSFSFITTSVNQIVSFGYSVDRSSSLPVEMFIDTALFAPTSTVCFGPDTKILCRFGEKTVKDLEEGIDEIYGVDGSYQVLRNLLITGPTKSLILIKQNSISPGIPSRDTILTRGHRVILPGIATPTKAIDVPGRVILKDQSHLVYSPYVTSRMIGLANGLSVIVDGQDHLKRILDR